MKYLLMVLVGLFMFESCKNNERSNEQKDERHITDLKKQFKLRNQKKFRLENSFDWEKVPAKFRKLDSADFALIWQTKGRVYDSYGAENDYFYSWQDRDTNLIELTMLTFREDEGYAIVYCIYDRKGKSVDQFTAASSYGDGGWYSESYGKFIDGSTFEQTRVEQEVVDVDTIDNMDIYEGDSSKTHFIIGKNGKVKVREIEKRHFRIKE